MRSRCPLFLLLLLSCASRPPAEVPGYAEAAPSGQEPSHEAPHHHDGAGGTEEGGQGHKHHGAMPHRFEDAEQWAKRFEDPARDQWQQPEKVLEAMQLSSDMVVADIGSATGYFAVRIARAVPRGKVLGVDIEPDMIRYLNERAKKEGISNLESVLAAVDDPALPSGVDRVLVVNTYHHIAGRLAYFAKVRESLSARGQVTIVDFKQGQLPVGPPEAHRIPLEQVVTEMASAGFSKLSVIELPYQYVVSFGVAQPQ